MNNKLSMSVDNIVKKYDAFHLQRSKSCSDIDRSMSEPDIDSPISKPSSVLIEPYVIKNSLKFKIVGLKKYNSEN